MRNLAVLLWLSLASVSLVGCSKGTTNPSANDQPGTTPSAVLGAKIVQIKVGEEGFSPNQIDLKRGEKATLRFTRVTESTCATAVVFPELGLNKPLPLNQPVDIEVPTDPPRTLNFQCGMGMYQSKVVVH